VLKHRFERFSAAGKLHFAAHSHHLWPDVAFEAHQQAWLDAARLIDDKWGLVFGEVIPEARRHVARLLGVPDPDTIVFAPNTHELVVRVASCLTPPFRVVTSDAEFHSFRRQSDRWEEAGAAEVVRVAAEPFSSFPGRFIEASAGGDLVYLSHVFFDSGYVVPDLGPVIAAAHPDAFVVVDGYHAVMALPVDISPVADRIFYLGGGYKYAMAGEGACFMHCPPGWGERPVDTGWYAGFDSLTTSDRTIGYAKDASRFWGATFDPSSLYRFNSVQRMLEAEGVTVDDIHAHVAGLQRRFVDELRNGVGPLRADMLVPAWGGGERGHFLAFTTPAAAQLKGSLRERGVITDYRDDRLRIGFGAYHDDADVSRLLEVLADIG
jgi:selenocysteine lyase/cysteine desulfurase